MFTKSFFNTQDFVPKLHTLISLEDLNLKRHSVGEVLNSLKFNRDFKICKSIVFKASLFMVK